MAFCNFVLALCAFDLLCMITMAIHALVYLVMEEICSY
uniref:Uncharacterized protein n=1 Tax=Rhizophora mucronata TaxID=61149 RepID=A0A2P2QER2_RHIMU